MMALFVIANDLDNIKGFLSGHLLGDLVGLTDKDELDLVL
jgi:hypothetical protein